MQTDFFFSKKLENCKKTFELLTEIFRNKDSLEMDKNWKHSNVLGLI